MDFSAMQFIISVTLHVCPLICATKEKQTMMVTVLYQIRKSNIVDIVANVPQPVLNQISMNRVTRQVLNL